MPLAPPSVGSSACAQLTPTLEVAFSALCPHLDATTFLKKSKLFRSKRSPTDVEFMTTQPNLPSAAPPQPKVGAFCWPAESRPPKGRSKTAPLRDSLAS